MDIKQLLSGYQNRMLKKFEKQAENEIKQATEQDVVRKGIEQIKKNTLEQYKMLHEGISEEDGTPFTDDELADLINKITLPMEWKLSQKTKNLIDNIYQTKQRRADNLSDVLNEVHLLTSYVEDPKEITKILETYKIIQNGKLNMELF
jgi:hypothetical protein